MFCAGRPFCTKSIQTCGPNSAVVNAGENERRDARHGEDTPTAGCGENDGKQQAELRL
jgi:hypothetical protein